MMTRGLKPSALIVALGLTGGFTLTTSGGAHAQDEAAGEMHAKPFIEGGLTVEFQNDLTFDSDDPASEINDFYNSTELGLGINLTNLISVHSTLVLEPVFDPMPFDDRFLEDHGAYVEELFLQVAFDGFRIFGGKYDPSFGQAWDVTPGVYGTDFAEDYELVERIGFGFEFSLGDMYSGTHTIQANVFFADTSDLSQSIITNRGKVNLFDGGPSNTEALDSFSVTISGEAIPGLENYTYHLGLRHQAHGIADPSNELGLVGNIGKRFDLANGAALEGIVEGVYLNNAFAGPDDIYYLTAGGAYLYGPWSIAASLTLRNFDIQGGQDFTDHLAHASVGYEIIEGLAIAAGYKWAEEGGIDSHTFGLLLAYETDFAFGTSPGFPFLP